MVAFFRKILATIKATSEAIGKKKIKYENNTFWGPLGRYYLVLQELEKHESILLTRSMLEAIHCDRESAWARILEIVSRIPHFMFKGNSTF